MPLASLVSQFPSLNGGDKNVRLTTVSVMNGVGVQERGVGGDGWDLWLDLHRRARGVVCRRAWELTRVIGERMFMVG
jgi:hypothetical protein